jgi:hypothetical protein
MPELNNPQNEFIQLPHRFRAFVSGFGGGKTWVGSMAMCARYWQSPLINQGYFAPTYSHIRDIFFPTIEEVAHTIDLRVDIKESNKEVHFYSGRQYRGTTICRSMDKPQHIIGYKCGYALVDEFDVLDSRKAQHAWRKILSRLRWANAINGADVTTTPEGFRETHRLFVVEPAKKPELKKSYGLVQASTRDNELNLPDGYIQSLLDTYPSELVDAYIDGKFCNLSTGTIYRAYNRNRCESTESIKDNEPLFIGMDFNVGKMAATIYVQRSNGWHAVAELKDIFDTPDMAAIIRNKWPNNRIVIYPDASGKSRKTVDASKSDIAILIQAGFKVKVNSVNPAVKDRILAVNKQFEKGRLWVNSRLCPTVATNLEQQAYDANGEPDKKSGFDHQCFAGDQYINTENGRVKIKYANKKGKVLCHDNKYRDYVNLRIINDYSTTLLITLSNGGIIRCTPDHEFLTTKGWVRAEYLIGEKLCNQSLLVQLSKNISVKNIIYAAITFNLKELDCIEKFGKINMGKFQKGLLYIILIMIKLITKLKTLSLCGKENIQHIMVTIEKICQGLQLKHLKNGIQAKLVKNGMKNIIKTLSICCIKKLKTIAPNVAKSTSEQTPEKINFAQETVSQTIEDYRGLTMRKELALYVGRSLGLIGTKKRKHVENYAVRVLTLTIDSIEPVYCLTVPDFGMFSVSGLIASNCDATGYPIAYEFPITRKLERISIGGI